MATDLQQTTEGYMDGQYSVKLNGPVLNQPKWVSILSVYVGHYSVHLNGPVCWYHKQANTLAI